jgi:hypothetical protein
MGTCGIFREAGGVACECDDYFAFGAVKFPRRDETIAAVIARAADDEHRAGTRREQPGSFEGSRDARAFHQRRLCVREYLAFDCANVAHGVDGGGLSRHDLDSRRAFVGGNAGSVHFDYYGP